MAIPDGFIGSLEFFVHQARDIHNICIYQKQDVYARFRLTSDPETSVSTKIINGGGKHPVFNETLHLKVRTFDSSLKCELWMLSRVKNYLQDQLLGFALVPFSQFAAGNGKTMREFELSSTDIFHSPAGFVSLTMSYTGSTEELMVPTSTVGNDLSIGDSNHESIPCEYANMEFPDLNVVNENKMMISEYLGIPCPNSESQNGECLISDNCLDCPLEKGVDIFSTDCEALSADGAVKNDSPLSIVSAADSETSAITGSPNQKSEKNEISKSGGGSSEKPLLMPVININIEPEQPVVQQDIVDLYMKSMQQFTESLAKMKFPLTFENNGGSSSSGGGNVENGKDEASEKRGARVFYGSRAFF